MTHNAPAPYELPQSKTFRFGDMSLELPRLVIGKKAIYVLNTLGGNPYDTLQLAVELTRMLQHRPGGYDGFVTPEGKALPLIYQTARLIGKPFYVLRKQCKAYMGVCPISVKIDTITSGNEYLFLDDKDRTALANKHWIFLDDVVSSGATLDACIQIVDKVGGQVIDAYALAVEGDCRYTLPVHYLAKLPIEEA